MLSPVAATRWLEALPPTQTHAMDPTMTAHDARGGSAADIAAKTLLTHPAPEIPPAPADAVQSPRSAHGTSPDDPASTNSTDSARSPSSSHARRLSNSSAMDETPTSGSSLLSTSRGRQQSATTDDGSSVSSQSASPPNHARPIEFTFASPTHRREVSSGGQMEDVPPASTSAPTPSSRSLFHPAHAHATAATQHLPTHHHHPHQPAQMKDVPEEDQEMADEGGVAAATDSMKISERGGHHHATKQATVAAYGSGVPAANTRAHQPASNGGGHTATGTHRSHAPSSAHTTPTHSPRIGPTTAGTPASLKRGQGFSCHHCKTHKLPEALLFCSNQSKKGPGKKRCRKKYCDSCLRRLYGHPADRPLSEVVNFQCPACLGNCVCAGCERKAAPPPSTDPSDSGAASSNSSTAHSPSPVPPLLSLAASGSSPAREREGGGGSSSGKDRGQTKPTTPQGKPPGKKRRTSIDSGVSVAGGDEVRGEGACDDESTASMASGEPLTVATPLLTHGRRHSGEYGIPSILHLPQPSSLPFAVPPHAALPPRVGTNSTSNSPRLTSTPSNRMIQIPNFSLAPTLSVLNPSAGLFSSAIHQSVAAATSAAAAHAAGGGLHSAMDLSGSDPMHLHPLLGPAAMDSTAATATTSAGNSPFAASRSLTRRTSSAFSPVNGTSISAPHTPDHLADVTNRGMSGAAGLSPVTSPSIIQRLILQPTSTVLGGGEVAASALDTSGALLHKPLLPSAVMPSSAPVGSPESNELMKVLANVACSSSTSQQPAAAASNNSASLPPAHPPVKAEPSPKLGSFMPSLFLSPTHAALTLPPPATSTGLSPAAAAASLASSSLASISAMKAQHAMEVQCLLQQQQQQLAELELRAMKELEAQQQALHHQRIAQSSAVKSPLLGPMRTHTPTERPIKQEDTQMADAASQSAPANSTAVTLKQ